MPKRASLTLGFEALPRSAHVCVVYETDQQYRDAVVAFVAAGVERGERCVYIADRDQAAAAAPLRHLGLDPNDPGAPLAVTVLSAADTYVAGGEFHPEAMLDVITTAYEEAVREGFSGLRVTGEMSWCLTHAQDFNELARYESLVNELFETRQLSALCQYDRRRFPARDLIEVVRTHPYVVYGDRVCRNFHYIPPAEYAHGDTSEMTLERLLASLLAREEAEQAVRESEERYRRLFELSPLAVLILVAGRVSLANQSAARLLGAARPLELIDLAWRDLLDRASCDELEHYLQPDQAVDEAVRLILNVRRLTGDLVGVEWSMDRIPENGEPRMLVVLRDLTEQARAEAAEQRAREAAERADRLAAEMRSLSQLAQSGAAPVTSRSFGLRPMQEGDPSLYDHLVTRHAALLRDVVDERAYRVDHQTAERIWEMAYTLYSQRANERDVVDIHTTALRRNVEEMSSRKAQVLIEEGRFVVLELMGRLLSLYRSAQMPGSVARDIRQTDGQPGSGDHE